MEPVMPFSVCIKEVSTIEHVSPSVNNKTDDVSRKVLSEVLEKEITSDVKFPSVKRMKSKVNSHEAEDVIRQTRFLLHRRLSVQTIQDAQLKQTINAKLEAISGELWQCIDCALDEYDGEIYTFKVKPEFDFLKNPESKKKYQKKLDDIFPAVEPEAEFLDILLNPNPEKLKKFRNENVFDLPKEFEDFDSKSLDAVIAISNELKFLGYRCWINDSGAYIEVPCRKALLSRWKCLRNEYPDLPKLDVANSEGVADDISFVEAYFSHDVLLSSGKEFIHDHFIHIIPTISVIISHWKNGMSYSKGRFNLVKHILKSYRKLVIAKQMGVSSIPNNVDLETLEKLKKNYAQMEAALGSFVDVISADPFAIKGNNEISIDESSMKDHLSVITLHWNPWKEYWDRRFGVDKVLCSTELTKLWELINDIEKTYDKNRTV